MAVRFLTRRAARATLEKMLRPLTIVLLLLAVLPRGELRAEQAAAEAATSLFERARRLLNEARFAEAVRLLERAAGIARRPGEEAQIQLYLGIGHWLQGAPELAHAAFVAALTKDPTLALDPERHKPELVAAFRRAREGLAGHLELRGGPAGARVLIDEEPVGRLPLSQRVAIGVHTLRVEQGTRSWQRKVTVGPDARVEVVVRLSPAPGPEVQLQVRPQTRPRARTIWPWVAAGGAVVATAVGTGLGLSAKADYDEYLATQDFERYRELTHRVPQKATGANVAFAVAGTLAITAVVLWLVE